jgi:hypothetical protein
MEPNREYRTTKEVAAAYNVQPQTVLAALCRHGHYLGLRPVKLPNRLLGWPADAKARISAGEVHQ